MILCRFSDTFGVHSSGCASILTRSSAASEKASSSLWELLASWERRLKDATKLMPQRARLLHVSAGLDTDTCRVDGVTVGVCVCVW